MVSQHKTRLCPCLTLLVIFIIATQIGCTADCKQNTTDPSIHESKDRFYVMNATNRFLSLFFEELESGLD